MSIRRPLAALPFVAALSIAASCHSKPPAVVVAPPPLSDSAAAALRWIDAHAIPIAILDSARPPGDRTPFLTFVGNSRVLGVSELVEGTREFPQIVQAMLASLADRGFRGIAVQAPMAEAMELDRYVRTGVGNPSQGLRVLGPHWHTQDVLGVVEWIRAYNRNRASTEQIHFYGFELPSAGHALRVLTTLSDSVAGRPLNLWLRQQLQCVSTGESAAWGREGPAADSTFWNRCRGATAAVVDSLVALRARVASTLPNALANLTFAEQMARLAQHDADVGLRRLPRQQAVAEHILWLANGLGPDGNLLVWGRDVESGRLTGEGGLVQSAVPLASTLGDRYRNLAFTAGQGVVRAQPINVGQREPGGETNMRLRPPRRESYEDVLNRAAGERLFLDMRGLGADTAGAWLKGPHQARLISGIYSDNALGVFETSLQFPSYYDGVLFAKHVTAAIPLKH